MQSCKRLKTILEKNLQALNLIALKRLSYSGRAKATKTTKITQATKVTKVTNAPKLKSGLAYFKLVFGGMVLVGSFGGSMGSAHSEVIEGWTLEAASSQVSEKGTLISELVWRQKGLVRSFEMRIGCRHSVPVPGIVLRMPALSTDIMEPENKAVVFFTDEPDDPRKYVSGIVLSVRVETGDIVMVPTGNAEQSAKLEEAYRLMLSSSKVGTDNVSLFFVQNRHRERIDLSLKNFAQNYEVMRSSCNELK